jgi:SAM-dependent methyltransferase
MSSGFWYEERHAKTSPSARKILGYIWPYLKPQSVLDVGCGVGTWLSISRELGASKVQGLEGSDLKPEQLKINANEFKRSNLVTPPILDTKYDLAINLEVAEHLPKDSAENFVKYLTQNSNAVLFSAAPPAQGGEGHINEQWPQYWTDLFRKNGFEVVDVIRSLIWNDDQVLAWYKQNTLLFVNKSEAADIKMQILNDHTVASDWHGNSVIHPDMWHSSRRFRGLVRGVLEIASGKRY